MINIIDLSECPLSSRAGTYWLAPVYDNGASFATKLGDEKIQRILDNEERITQNIITSTTAYSLKGKQLFAKDILNLPYEELHQAIIRNVPLIIEKFDDVKQIFMDIPESYHDLYICSNCRKEFYIKSMEYRINELLVPAYNRYAEKGLEL